MLVAMAASLLIGALLCEIGLRAYGATQSRWELAALDPLAVQIEPNGEFGYRQRPHATFHYVNGTSATSNGLGYRGPEVPLVPAPGTIRVLLFGGSSSHGWGVSDDQTIDAHMRRDLAELFPARRFEVVNLAFDGYDSYQDLTRLTTDGLRLHPSVVILNTGINDVRNAWFAHLSNPDPRTLIWEAVLQRLRREQAQGHVALWTRVKHYSFLARFPGFMADRLKRAEEERRRSAAKDSAQAKPASRAPYPEAAEYFEQNVRSMVKLSQAAGAAVLLSTPPSALPWYPPDTTSQQSYWVYNARITQAYRDELNRRLAKIAADEQALHHDVRYVAARLDPAAFLDDVHLTDQGNASLARIFINEIQPFVTPAASKRDVVHAGS